MTEPAAARPHRGRALAIALIAVIVLVYVTVVALYALNERAVNIEGCTDEPPSDAVLLSLTPESVNAATDRLLANLSVVSFGPIAAQGTSLLSEPLTILVSDTDGPRTFTIAQDEIPSPQSVNFITDGYVERWPFDAHSVDVAIVSLQGEGDRMRAVPTLLCGSAHVPGWTFSSQEIPGTDEVVVDGEQVTQVRITATRSIAAVAFGVVILCLMAVLPVLGLTVAIVAYRGIRKVEATLMSWMAAMLFATIPLRTFLPGSPPIGSWVDYLVVLWVVAGLVLGLVIYVLAWLRWGTRGERGAADGSIAVVAAGAAASAADSAADGSDGGSAD
ncbi:DUF4436 family protein [uncultured Microbacterium sp.]|uniref:DUF4436 family protein n=1 Tax=uncultured Microbacterium sp. TaxID=191216 RepID=UPI0028D58C47|nr:DUF4436 family protein [uncultured Microbacterium sp.]